MSIKKFTIPVVLFMALSCCACGGGAQDKEAEIPYSVAIIATTSNSEWEQFTGTSILYSQSQLQNFTKKLDAGLQDRDSWSMKTEDGTVIDRDSFNVFSARLETEALIISIFCTPNSPAQITSHSLWKNNDTAQLNVECRTGMLTAEGFVMVILEVSPQDVAGVKEVCLNLTDRSWR